MKQIGGSASTFFLTQSGKVRKQGMEALPRAESAEFSESSMVQLAGASATNQVAIVTGGGEGLRLAIAKRPSDGGCRVVLCASTFTRVDEAQAGFTPAMKQLVDAPITRQPEWAAVRRARSALASIRERSATMSERLLNNLQNWSADTFLPVGTSLERVDIGNCRPTFE